MKRILYLGNDVTYFLSHRLPLAKKSQSAGYEVHVALPVSEGISRIREEGFIFHDIPMARWGSSPWNEIKCLSAIYHLYRKVKPDLVHQVTIKPVLYGGLMARLARVPAVVNSVSGLGYVFLSKGVRANLLRTCVKAAYFVVFGHPQTRVIFQNPDDNAEFVKCGLLSQEKAVLVRGSGVDMQQYIPVPEPGDLPVVILPSRMLWDKGVGEFVAAADMLRSSGVMARFLLVGDSETGNPASVPVAQLEAWQRNGVIEWTGHRNDMPDVFAQANIVCLPSYREGLPKVLIEAAACGRAIVTTKVPGCREIVEDGANGLIVPVHDSEALAAALRKLIENPELRHRMGARGREIAVNGFSIEQVVDEILTVYRSLLP